MQFTPDQIRRFEARRRAELARDRPQARRAAAPLPSPQQRGRGGFLSSLISEGGALGGAAAGAAAGSVVPVLGTAIGGILGAGIGAFGGRLAENKVRDNRFGLSDAAQEGALSAVLAGPLKLGKYATSGVKALKGGAGVTKALAGAADDAAKFTLRGAAGAKATQAGEKLAIKGFKFTPSQLANFSKKYGEDASKVITRNGLAGGTVDDFTKAIAGQQSRFDELVTSAGTIKKIDLQKALKGVYSKLSKSAPSDTKELAKKVKGEVDGLIKNMGDEISASDLNVIRRQYDDLVNYTNKLADPARYGVNKRIADALRKTIQSASGSDELRLTGMEISKLRQLSDAVAMQANRGRGANPLSLTTLLAGGVGAGVGGWPGAVGAATASKLVNNPKVLKATAEGVMAGGRKAATSGARSAGLSQALAGATRGQLAEGVLTASGAQSPNMSPISAPSPMANSSSIMPTEYAETANDSIAEPAIANPFDPANIDENLAKIVAGGGDLGDIKEYVSLVEALQGIKAASGPVQPEPLNSTAAGIVTDLENGLTNIRALGDQIAASGANNPGIGWLRGKIPFDTEAQGLQANIARVKQVIGKALEGGVLRKEDEVKYAKILPTLNDTDAVAQQKIQMIAEDLERKLAIYKQNLGAGGGGSIVPSELATAIGL